MQNTINITNGKCMYCIGDREFEIIGKVKVVNGSGEPTGEVVPLVDIPQMSDYEYQLMALNDRLERPEYYERSENVPETIEKLKAWLSERIAEGLYLQFRQKYKRCFDLIGAKTIFIPIL